MHREWEYDAGMKDWHIAEGFRFAGIVSKLRSEPDRRDLAVIVSDRPATAAGVFTQNRVCAAPVHVCRERLPRNDARAIVICSGNANACTGEQGMTDARRMAELVADGIGCSAEQVLVASTGVIGRPLPMAILEAGIPKATAAVQFGADAFNDAAHAILTTDTRIKVATRRIGSHAITGFAKGAAMIGPNLATMLGFLLTDAAVAANDLHAILRVQQDAFKPNQPQFAATRKGENLLTQFPQVIDEPEFLRIRRNAIHLVRLQHPSFDKHVTGHHATPC